MRSDSEVNYAANPYGMPPERRRKRALPTSLLLTVAGITLFAGGVLAVISFSGSGGVSGPPPMIEADATPMKSRPADTGTDEAPPPDRLVYERLSGATRPSVERLLPPPEQPMPRPIVMPDPPPPAPEPTRPVLLPPPASPPANMLAPPSAAPPAPSAATTAAKPAVPAAPPPATTKLSPPTTAAAPHLAAPPAALRPPGASPGQPVPPAAASSGGGWRIQLASVRSEAEAAAEWRRLTSRFPAVLGGMSLQVAKADLGDKGVYYRVQGGGVDETRARAACDQLKSQNVGCVVVKP